jgi:hypothetical protein
LALGLGLRIALSVAALGVAGGCRHHGKPWRLDQHIRSIQKDGEAGGSDVAAGGSKQLLAQARGWRRADRAAKRDLQGRLKLQMPSFRYT